MPQNNKILIIGSSGMFGTALARELSGDYKVIGLDLVHRTSYTCPPKPERRRRIVHRFIKGDITERKSIADIVDKIKPNIVMHTAAYTDVDGCELDKKRAYKINTEGTKNIALACKACDATLIYISTDFVFDGRKKNPYNETDRPRPLSVYGDSKLKGELAVKKLLKKYFIIRTSWLYGKHGKNFVDTILSKAKAEKILRVADDQVGSPTYTNDLAKAVHRLLNKISLQLTAYSLQPYGIYHISNSGSVSWYEYAKEILKTVKSKTKVMPIASGELARPAKRPAMSVLDNAKFMKFTGYEMRPWGDALKEYLS